MTGKEEIADIQSRFERLARWLAKLRADVVRVGAEIDRLEVKLDQLVEDESW